jgi:nifR3 family TIM-barrel protein
MQLVEKSFDRLGGQAPCAPTVPSNEPIIIGNRTLPSRYFLAPLAGYTHLAYRVAVRELGGLGLATTDLVQAAQLVAGSKWARELVRTSPADRPLSVQIYGGRAEHLVAAAKWLAREGYEAIDINMGCPVAKITGQGGGARLMCDTGGAVDLVRRVIEAVNLPVTVKMRLGWDRNNLTAPLLAREFERLGVAALTIHGRTRQQGFRGGVHLEGIRSVVESVERIPVIGNGDVRTVEDAWRMRRLTGCAAVAIGRGALFDPWIFRKLELAHQTGDERADPSPSSGQQVDFLWRHFHEMVAQHGEYQSCRMFRKFVAWYGARLGIPEDLEDRLRRFESIAEFDQLVAQIRRRHGTRVNSRPTAEFKVPKGPVELW